MTAVEIVQNKVKLENLKLKEHPYDDRFTFLEIQDERNVSFKMYYYIVDLKDSEVYYGAYEIPDGVNVERIRRGLETAI